MTPGSSRNPPDDLPRRPTLTFSRSGVSWLLCVSCNPRAALSSALFLPSPRLSRVDFDDLDPVRELDSPFLLLILVKLTSEAATEMAGTVAAGSPELDMAESLLDPHRSSSLDIERYL